MSTFRITIHLEAASSDRRDRCSFVQYFHSTNNFILLSHHRNDIHQSLRNHVVKSFLIPSWYALCCPHIKQFLIHQHPYIEWCPIINHGTSLTESCHATGSPTPGTNFNIIGKYQGRRKCNKGGWLMSCSTTYVSVHIVCVGFPALSGDGSCNRGLILPRFIMRQWWLENEHRSSAASHQRRRWWQPPSSLSSYSSTSSYLSTLCRPSRACCMSSIWHFKRLSCLQSSYVGL